MCLVYFIWSKSVYVLYNVWNVNLIKIYVIEKYGVYIILLILVLV